MCCWQNSFQNSTRNADWQFALCFNHLLMRFFEKNIPYGVFLLLAIFFSQCQPNLHREGERLYKTHCANCHMDTGEGLSALIPPIAGADFLGKNRERLPCLLRHGIKDSIVVNGKIYAEEMPGVPTLSDVHVTNLLNYINSNWGNNNQPYQLDEVRALLGKCDSK